jgi:hypothetical protein
LGAHGLSGHQNHDRQNRQATKDHDRSSYD